MLLTEVGPQLEVQEEGHEEHGVLGAGWYDVIAVEVQDLPLPRMPVEELGHVGGKEVHRHENEPVAAPLDEVAAAVVDVVAQDVRLDHLVDNLVELGDAVEHVTFLEEPRLHA